MRFARTQASLLLVVPVLALIDCGGGTDASDDGEAVVVRSLTPGDRACYMAIEDDAGAVSEEEAAFELCERSELVGARVRLTRESTAILASACEGDPDCALRDTVDLIVQAEAAP